MSYADDLRTEIEVLKRQVADLDNRRIERDSILKQKADLEKEIQGHRETLATLESDIQKTKDRKAAEEAKKNEELDQKVETIKQNIEAIRETSDNHARIALEHEAKGKELASREAKIGATEALLTERGNEQSKGEKAHQEAVLAFSKKVSEYDEKVKSLDVKSQEVVSRENAVKFNEASQAEQVKKQEVQWNLIHKANAELDSKKASLDTFSKSVESANENVTKGALNISAEWAKLDQREKDLVSRETKLSADNKEIQTKLDGLTLRELECQGKERALDKRERIIVLKEQANGGE